MEDRTQLWWDVRPHARLGTVEVREMDAQTDLDDALAARRARPLPGPRRGRALDPADPSAEALGWSMFRAARDGLDAEILDEDGACARCRRSPAPRWRGS